MEQRLLGNAQVVPVEAYVAEENLLGMEGDGIQVVIDFVSRSNIGVGALCEGLARRSFDEAKAYSENRMQEGFPIKFHQATGIKLFDISHEGPSI